MDINTVNMQALESILQTANNEQQNLAEKLVKATVAEKIDIAQLETMGTIIDLYV